MSPTHANKRGVRYRYYVSRPLLNGSTKGEQEGQRVPALALESLVSRRLRDQLANQVAFLDVVQNFTSDPAIQKRLLEHANVLFEDDGDIGARLRAFVRTVAVRIQVHSDRIDISFDCSLVCQWLDGTINESESVNNATSHRQLMTLSIPASLRRAGKELRIVVDDGSQSAPANPVLVRLLARAHLIRERMLNERNLTLDDIAASEGIGRGYTTRLFRISLLAPSIFSAILSGRQPPELNARRLLEDTRFPLDWNEQRQRLGFELAN